MLKAELYKYLKHQLLTITIVMPIILSLSTLYFVHTSSHMDISNNVILTFSVYRNLFYSIMVPVYIIIICRICGEFEWKGNNWVNLITMPIKKWKIYFLKELTLCLMVSILYLSYIMGILLIRALSNEFPISFSGILIDSFLSFLCTFATITFFYIFSLEKIPLIIYIGISIIVEIHAFLSAQSSDLWKYSLVSYPTVVPSLTKGIGNSILCVLIISILLSLIGSIRFSRRDWV